MTELPGGQLDFLRSVQSWLEGYYAIERRGDVAEFVRVGAAGSRETLFVRESTGQLDLRLCLPPWPMVGARGADDALLQMVEGVSHFVFVAERARTELPATELELELQAEIDKFMWASEGQRPEHWRGIHRRLFGQVRFLHGGGSARGSRYRLAHRLAERYLARVMERDGSELRRSLLRRFYRVGQTEKLRLASAA